jgi:hypothetical protein
MVQDLINQYMRLNFFSKTNKKRLKYVSKRLNTELALVKDYFFQNPIKAIDKFGKDKEQIVDSITQKYRKEFNDKLYKKRYNRAKVNI